MIRRIRKIAALVGSSGHPNQVPSTSRTVNQVSKGWLRSSAGILGIAFLLGVSAPFASAQQFRPAIEAPLVVLPPGPLGPVKLTIPPPPPGWMGSGPGPAPTGSPFIAAPQPAFSFFDWTQGPAADQITVRMSPDLYNRFFASGLQVTYGTVTSSPRVLGGTPGARVLNRDGDLFDYVQTNGFATVGNRTLFVVILHDRYPGIHLFGVRGPYAVPGR
jgi:hypothetical protein